MCAANQGGKTNAESVVYHGEILCGNKNECALHKLKSITYPCPLLSVKALASTAL
jgi:hypothetical protein